MGRLEINNLPKIDNLNKDVRDTVEWIVKKENKAAKIKQVTE